MKKTLGPRTRTLVLAALLLGGGLLFWLRGIRPGLETPLGDFANYYTAARVVADGEPLSRAYLDFLWFQQRIDSLGIEGQLGGFIPHPPPAALVMLPLAGLSPPAAKQLWTCLNLALLGAVVWLLTRLTRLGPGPVALIVLLAGPALWHNFAFGQVYVLLLASLLGALYLRRSGRPVLAGISLGLMIPIKLFGAPWILYWAWRRHWRAVAAAVGTSAGVVAATWFAVGTEPFYWFFHEVFPRHLAGEIQDPFHVRFQSWHSLYRRLFVLDPLLNPRPALESSALFEVALALTFWALMVWGVAGLTGRRQSERLSDSAWMVIVLLLLSPASASYHLLLLILPAVCFAGLAHEAGRPWRARLIGLGFAAIHLPHYIYLEGLAEGWWNLAAYTRLWALLAFSILVAVACGLGFSRRRTGKTALVAAVGMAVALGEVALLERPKADDGAVLFRVEGQEMDPRFGLIMDQPKAAADTLLFTSGERRAARYAPFDGSGRRRVPPAAGSYYRPQLHPDGRRLLLEGWDGGAGVYLTEDGAAPTFVAEGRSPVWLGAGNQVAFLRRGEIWTLELPPRVRDYPSPHPLVYKTDAKSTGLIQTLSSSVSGRLLLYFRCVDRDAVLMLLDLKQRRERPLVRLESRARSPELSPDEAWVAYADYRGGNWDIWRLSTVDGRRQRLTSHPGVDRQPTWVSDSRLVFASDRGRGLQFTVLYQIEIPAEQTTGPVPKGRHISAEGR